MIGTLGHGKDIVDAINACDKIYLKEIIFMVGTPEVDDKPKIIEDHAMVGETKSSLTLTCKKLLKDNVMVHRVKSYIKHGKRETE